MDILYELSYLFSQDAATLDGKDPEYRNMRDIEGQLLEKIAGTMGEELHGKLIDVQEEIACHNFLNCFLCGVRLGFAASKLGQGS